MCMCVWVCVCVCMGEEKVARWRGWRGHQMAEKWKWTIVKLALFFLAEIRNVGFLIQKSELTLPNIHLFCNIYSVTAV